MQPLIVKETAAVAGAAPCSAKLWAWWDAKAKTYKFVYPSRLCVIICSADGFKRATRDGEGKVVRVTVSPNAESSHAGPVTPGLG